MPFHRGLVVLCISTLMVACVTEKKVASPEEIQARQQIIELFKARVAQGVPNAPTQNNSASSQQQLQTPVTPATPVVTEQTLKDQLNAWPVTSGITLVDRVRDGLVINGEHYADPEGELTASAHNMVTGDIGYTLSTGKNQAVIKLMRAGAGDPVVIAHAEHDRGVLKVRTVTGKNLNGEAMLITSRGLLLARDNALFFYEAGVGTRSIQLPAGYGPAQWQRGDIASTGWMLITKKTEAEGGAKKGLWDSFKDIGKSVGAVDSDDFKMLEVATGKTVNLNIVRMDKVPMFDDMGLRQSGHIYWRVQWFMTEAGPLVLTLENVLGTKLNGTLLSSGITKTLAERTLGIARFDALPQADGKIKLAVQVGTTIQEMDDLVSIVAGGAVAGTTGGTHE